MHGCENPRAHEEHMKLYYDYKLYDIIIISPVHKAPAKAGCGVEQDVQSLTPITGQAVSETWAKHPQSLNPQHVALIST